MPNVQEMLNRIKLFEQDSSVYTLLYIDRFKNLKELKFSDIKKIDNNSVLFDDGGEEVEMPIERVKKVCRKDECLWANDDEII